MKLIHPAGGNLPSVSGVVAAPRGLHGASLARDGTWGALWDEATVRTYCARGEAWWVDDHDPLATRSELRLVSAEPGA